MTSVISKTKPIKPFSDKSTRFAGILFNLKRELSQYEGGKHSKIGMLLNANTTA